MTYNSLEQPACMAWNFLNLNLVGVAITILKNDGVRQWGWGYPIYEMEVIKFHGSKPPTRYDPYVMYPYPYAPCMVYLPTFGPFFGEM